MKVYTIQAENTIILNEKLSAFYDSGIGEILQIKIFGTDVIELVIVYKGA